MKIISIRLICLIIFTFFLAACSFTKSRTTADFDIDYNKHLIKPDSNKLTKNIPELISYKELADNNKNNKDKLALYSVMVHNAPVRETLLGLAKSAKVNIDIHSNVDGNITLNAIQETMYLNSVSGMAESLIKGKNTPLEDCLSENEVEW